MKLLETLWAKRERDGFSTGIKRQTEVRCGVEAYEAAVNAGWVVEDGHGDIPVICDETLPPLRLEIIYEDGTARIVDLGGDA